MMKNTIVANIGFLGIISALLFCCYRSDAQTTILPTDANIQYIGRFDLIKPETPVFWLTGTEIRTKFWGTSISAIFSGDATYFNLIIDGRLSYFCFAGKGDINCPLAIGMRDTLHTISIIKRNSPWTSQTFKGFVLETGQLLSEPPARTDRRIEFYGDSMTQGAQVDVLGTGPDMHDFIYDNNYNSYAMMVARAFNAECSIVAKNGATLVAGQDKTDIPSVFNRVACSTESPLWNFSKWQADVVVINLGENDDPLPSNFTSTYIRFIKNIRIKYPDAYIFLLSGPLWNGIDQIHCDAIQKVARTLNISGDKKVYFYKFKRAIDHPGHNRTADNIISSGELVAKIQTIIW